MQDGDVMSRDIVTLHARYRKVVIETRSQASKVTLQQVRSTGPYSYLLPCSFVNEPPYLRRLLSMSVISGMKLANMACRPASQQHNTQQHNTAHYKLLPALPFPVFFLVRAAILASCTQNVHNFRNETSKHCLMNSNKLFIAAGHVTLHYNRIRRSVT